MAFFFSALSALFFVIAACLVVTSIVCGVAILLGASWDWSVALLLLIAGCVLCELAVSMARGGRRC
ncbi:putative membrane protein [Rhizobium tibeticum]|nr:putative membrane protein [Rhizobium tibeticum]